MDIGLQKVPCISTFRVSVVCDSYNMRFVRYI